MNVCLLAFLQMWEVIGIIVLVVLLFGARKLPQLARSMAESIKEFKKANREQPENISDKSKESK